MAEEKKAAAETQTPTATAPSAIEKRSAQLVKEGFDAATASALAELEAARAEQLIKEGFAKDKVEARAIREVKFERLVAQKKRAGLTDEQARSVATEQLATDARNEAAAAAAAAKK